MWSLFASSAVAAAATVSGRITNSSTGLGVNGAQVWFFTPLGTFAASASTNPTGNYSLALPPGTYTAFTVNSAGLINKVFNNVECLTSCRPSDGAPIIVSGGGISNINFALRPGGRITGKVTDASTGAALAEKLIFIFGDDDVVSFGVTDASGNYTSGGLDTGTYYALTLTADDLDFLPLGPAGYIDELYNNVPCPNGGDCDGATPIQVTLGVTTPNVNFGLDRGARVSGTVSNMAGQGLANIEVALYDNDRNEVSFGFTDASGNYTTIAGLPTGTYFARTRNSQGYANRLYNNVPCVDCDVTTGASLTLTAPNTLGNINFTLPPGGRISGQVTADTGGALTIAEVDIYDTSGNFVTDALTDASGNYVTGEGLPPGNYFAKTSNGEGYVDELYNNIQCSFAFCNVTTGTPIAVSGGATTPGINFALTRGGFITGRVTNAATGAGIGGVGVFVNTANSTVAFTQTDESGHYSFGPIPPGTGYFVRTSNNLGFIDEVFNNVRCVPCNVTSGTAVTVVAGGTVSNIDFALTPGGQIRGRVTSAATGAPLANVQVQILTPTGAFVSAETTDSLGNYASTGLPTGTYTARTVNGAFTNLGLQDKLFDNITWCASCLLTGTPIPVTVGFTTDNIDFVLSATVNVAAGVNGAVATASSTFSSAFPPGSALDGDRVGRKWGAGGAWADATAGQGPDWLEVDFPVSRTITEIDVFSLQDNINAPVQPTLATTCAVYCPADFSVQTWNGLAWVSVPGGDIVGNTHVWTKVAVPNIFTNRIRVLVTTPRASYSRIVEVEAYAIPLPTPGAFTKLTPSSGAVGQDPSGVALTWQASIGASTYEYCVDTSNNNTCDTAWTSTANLLATLTGLNANTSYWWQVRARNPVGLTQADAGVWRQFTTGAPLLRVNVAAAANGGTATASSTFSSAFAPSGAINGEHKGLGWGSGGAWADATANDWSNDWLEVDFAGPQTINEIDVYGLPDNFTSPAEPTLSTACTVYCLTTFQVQTWDGAQWVALPGGTVAGNTQVWRQFLFAPVTTSRIRVLVFNAMASYSRIVEVEAYASFSQAPAAFGKSTPAGGATGVDTTQATLTWQASAGATRYEYCADTTNNNACDTTWTSVATTSAALSGLAANTTYSWQVRAVNGIGTTEADAGTWRQFTTGAPSIRVNVAAAVNGGTATASSTFSSAFAASGAINGEHKGVGWGSGGAWADATPNDFTTEWLQVDFAGPQTIGEIDVYGLPDNFAAPVEPTLSTACTVYCLTAFQVQTWDGAQWVTAGTASGNTQVWRQFLFTPVTTSRIRVLITSALASYSRIVEVEAYASFSQAPAAFGKSTPASGATGVDTGQAALTWRPSARATRYEYCVDTTNDNTCDGTWTSLAATSATLSGLRPNTAYSWQVRAVNALGTTEADGGMSRQFTTGALSIRVNVAAAANGGTATASSTFSYAFLANGVINGEHRGLGWGTSGAWADATPNQGGDWVQVDFAGPQTIDEIDVYGLPDNFTSPSEPTLGTMCTLYCLTDFQAQVWNGTQWVTVPGGTVGSNTQVWRQILFAPVTTSRIRVLISNALASYSRVVEVEAYATVVAQPAAFAKTAPSNAATPLSGQTTFTWQAAAGATRYEYCVDTTNNSACDTAWTSVGGFTSVTATLTAGTVYYWQVRAINAVGITVADGGTWWTVTPVTRMNVAAAANGATATASSSFSGSFPASGVINGDHKGLGWGTGGAWADATPGGWDDSIEVSFASAQTINEIDVYGLPDNFTTPAEPTIGTVCTLYCLREFQVQAWDAAHAQWGTVPGGTVVGNTWVWRQFVFPAVTTTKIRVVVSNAMASYSRVVEIEAYPAPSEPAAPTGGTVFTFGGGSGNLTTSTQAGFTLTPTAANWSFFGVGAPWPSIVFWSPTGATSDGEVRVTSGGSSFQFRSVDLYSSITPIPYTITGLAGSTVVFTISGTLGNTFGALATVANGQPTASIDTLLIRLTDPAPPGGVNPMGVDNIVLAR
jgi:3-methyladenine DNA glycosylase Mpg